MDGNKESNFSKQSCTHTDTSNSPWWRMDVGNVVRQLQMISVSLSMSQNDAFVYFLQYFIRKLVITNRSDCCWERLSNFEIRIGLSLDNNGNSNPLCGGLHSLQNETKSIVCPKPMLGRYVNIIVPGADQTLTLCEVEVYP